MSKGNVEMTLGITFQSGVPFIESRARAVGDGTPIPKGKILVMRTPILPPGASEEETEALTERMLVDDDDVLCRRAEELA